MEFVVFKYLSIVDLENESFPGEIYGVSHLNWGAAVAIRKL